MPQPRDDLEPRRHADAVALRQARLQGRKDAEDAEFVRQTRQHFASINGSIERFANALELLRVDVHEMKRALGARTRIRLTSWRVAGVLLGLIAGYGGILATVLAASH